METIDKAAFLRTELPSLLAQLTPNTERRWGKMNAQEMVEHMSYSMRQGSGKDEYELITPEEQVPRMQAFVKSGKPFRENTPNALIGDDTIPADRANITDAITELKEEIDHFFTVFEKEPNKKIMNPFFGALDFEMWVQLLHKHAWHHLNQFGIEKEQ